MLAVLYPIFNEGYSASAGTRLMRADLAEEGIWLAEVLANLMPGEPEVLGLLALMLLQHARREVGQEGAARACYLRALDLVGTDAERRYLERRLMELLGSDR